jgi:DNA-binding XRE family transcriptional regulator
LNVGPWARNEPLVPSLLFSSNAPHVVPMQRSPNTHKFFLREHRKAAGVTAQQMAEYLGIDRTSVHRLERVNWRVKSETLRAYAHRLGKAPEEFCKPPCPAAASGPQAAP